MIVPYRQRRYGGEIHHLPLITIILESRKRAVVVNAHIDSGTEHNVFSLDLANHLGLKYRKSWTPRFSWKSFQIFRRARSRQGR